MSKTVILALCLLCLGLPACRAGDDRQARDEPALTGIVAEKTVTSTPFPPTSAAPQDDYQAARETMVKRHLRGRDITDQSVLAAMAAVPRHEFVPAEWRAQAYADHPLPIGFGQTISQPYIVALMTQMLELQPEDRVLEIGTGSGYQAAVLAEVCRHVYSIEIIPELAQRAANTLEQTGYQGVVTKVDDGYWGWEEYAPFDAIIVTAAPDHIPQPLLNQLADGGRMVIPVGPPGGYQSLWVITRAGDEYRKVNWGGVAFVPLTRSDQ